MSSSYRFGDNVTKYAAGASSPDVQRRQQRNEDFKNQNITTAGDFNFDQYNRKDTEGTHISGAEVRHLRRNHQSNGGTGSRQDTYDVLTKQKEAGATFGKQAQAQYDRMGEKMEQQSQKKIDNLPDHLDANDPLVRQAHQGQGWGAQDQARYDKLKASKAKERTQNFANSGGSSGRPGVQQQQVVSQASSQEQNVNQDNDINNTVTGDNNYVSNTQDNSVRYFGGNTTNFNYQSSGEGPDTPATMMTLAGIGKPQDSPADTAKFIGKYSTINSDLQKKYSNTGTDVASKYIARAAQTNPIDVTALDQNISQGIQQHYDRATQQQALYQGDVFNFKTPEFKMPEAPDPIESNVSDIADDYKKDLDDD